MIVYNQEGSVALGERPGHQPFEIRARNGSDYELDCMIPVPAQGHPLFEVSHLAINPGLPVPPARGSGEQIPVKALPSGNK